VACASTPSLRPTSTPTWSWAISIPWMTLPPSAHVSTACTRSAAWASPKRSPGGALPGLGRCQLHQRRGTHGRWRHHHHLQRPRQSLRAGEGPDDLAPGTAQPQPRQLAASLAPAAEHPGLPHAGADSVAAHRAYSTRSRGPRPDPADERLLPTLSAAGRAVFPLSRILRPERRARGPRPVRLDRSAASPYGQPPCRTPQCHRTPVPNTRGCRTPVPTALPLTGPIRLARAGRAPILPTNGCCRPPVLGPPPHTRGCRTPAPDPRSPGAFRLANQRASWA